MFKRKLFILSLSLFGLASTIFAQDGEISNIPQKTVVNEDSIKNLPVVSYLDKRKYEIADIQIRAVGSATYEDAVIIGFMGLSVGDKIDIPGKEITDAIKKLDRINVFSRINVYAAKEEGTKVWLAVEVKEHPKISQISYAGIKKKEIKDLESRMGLGIDRQISPNQMNILANSMKTYYKEKGYSNAQVSLLSAPDLSDPNKVHLNVDIQKNSKTKVHTIAFEGNENVKSTTLERSMKKTRQKSNLSAWFRNFLRSTNYKEEDFEADKENVLTKYRELGYRDAVIVEDTVYSAAADGKPKKVNVRIKIDEGGKYYLGDINWIGNKEYSADKLQDLLSMKKGDVYNQKMLEDRLMYDEDGVLNIFYQNQGYLFSRIDPVEVNLNKDTVDLEVRVIEGPQATYRKVTITGNDRLYEDVIRRELRTKPGALFSRDDVMRSYRELAQMGHFDPETIKPDPQPDAESGTVDLDWGLVSKANDQVEFSAGWGQTGLIGKISLKFTNFSIKNLFNPGSYKGVIPQGEGQTLSLSAQTNARYYQSYSVQFFDPWFGGKRPNSLSVGAYYSRQTGVNSNYYSNNYNSYNSYYNSYYNNGYNNSYDNSYSNSLYQNALDPNKYIQMIGASVGYGKRLTWPDDFFYFQAEMSYQMYNMKDWRYFIVKDGTSNILSFNFTVKRNSLDGAVYPRRGTDLSLGLQITPPFSLFDGKDYKSMGTVDGGYESASKFRWVDYHKWKFKNRTFTPVGNIGGQRTVVFMTRVEYGFVGYFNKYKKSPFETFYVGGDGMSGYSSTYATETIGLRGYENGSIASQASAYSRLALELRYPLLLEQSATAYILGFVEAGNAWKDVGDFNPFQLKRSAGVGARVMLPMVGLVGIDWAYGFDKIGTSRSSSGSNWHFVIGQEF